MARFQIDNKVINHKDTIYQISQIVSLKKVDIKRERQVNKIPERNRTDKLSLAVAGSFIFGLVCLASENYFLFCVVLIISVVIIGFIFRHNKKTDEYNREVKRANAELENNRFYFNYGLSLRMSNGDKPLFLSSEEIVIEMLDVLTVAMNSDQAVAVSFEDVSIEVKDSTNVNIGGVSMA